MQVAKFRRRSYVQYWFLLPAMAIYIIFIVYPMVNSFVISLHRWDGMSPEKTFLGFEHYIYFFQDSIAMLALKNTSIWMVIMLIIPVGLGLGLALALNLSIPGRIAFRSIFYGPAIIPMVSVGIIWCWIYDPTFGVINEFLRLIGLPSLTRGWLGESDTALYSVIITAIWRNTGFPMILFLAGLQGIPNELYEAARLDGAGRLQCLRYITIPSLRETFIIVISLTVFTCLKVFDLVYIMTWGGPGNDTQVLATWMFFNTFLFQRAGYGSALAWMMTFTALLITFPYIRIMSRR